MIQSFTPWHGATSRKKFDRGLKFITRSSKIVQIKSITLQMSELIVLHLYPFFSAISVIRFGSDTAITKIKP